MRIVHLVVILGFAGGIALAQASAVRCADLAVSGATAPSTSTASTPAAPADAGDNAAKAQALVATAINLTDSDRAVAMLWQATELDPKLEDAYIYLAFFYNSRSQFDRVVQVYQKLVKYQPNETSAWLNIGEAYMSYSPPRLESALPSYLKAFALDPKSSFAAFRIGEIYAQERNRDAALRYLRVASADRAKNPEIADQAERLIRQIGS